MCNTASLIRVDIHVCTLLIKDAVRGLKRVPSTSPVIENIFLKDN
jgi:hypothetical protein